MRIDLCLCTFRRASVVDTLVSVDRARRPETVDLRIIVIDNDHAPTARARVAWAASGMRLGVEYIHAPGANISRARNAGLDAARADWIACLDDDVVVAPDWLDALVARQRETGADAVFGPSRARYGARAPGWIVAGDFHSQTPSARRGRVETGHGCNALFRRGGAPWRGARFAEARGQSGGEDTEFFARLHRAGARLAIAPEALVFESVSPERLSLRWLLRRRFRSGQSHADLAPNGPARAGRTALAAAKAAYCGLRALLARRPERRAFWLLRGALHGGVCAGGLGLPQPRLYGAPP